MRILIIEDDESLSAGLAYGLTEGRFVVERVPNGEEALRALESGEEFDVIILDVELPGINGFEVLKNMRTKDINIPVIMLTARGELAHKMEGFNFGADDYVIKPVALEELIARIEAIKRRSVKSKKQVLVHGDVELDPKGHKVYKAGKLQDISRREFTLLRAFLENVGRVLSRDHLTQILYGWKYDIDSNALEVHIHNLRKKFGEGFIVTKRGVGYLIEEKEASEDDGKAAK